MMAQSSNSRRGTSDNSTGEQSEQSKRWLNRRIVGEEQVITQQVNSRSRASDGSIVE